MKLRAEFDGEEFPLDPAQSERASVSATKPGVFSVLMGSKSFAVAVARQGAEFEVWTGGQRHAVALSDPRDRAVKARGVSSSGPVEIRAQMPGKVIKLLVEQGSRVTAGQGVIIVEAMKMQNEMKSPKDGGISKIYAAEGSTVGAGETLMVIE